MKWKAITALTVITFHGKLIYGKCYHNMKRKNFMKSKQNK